MKLPSFIKQNVHSRFEFTPRYYDERKERIEQIKAKYNGEHSTEATRARLHGSFKKNAKSKAKKSNLTLFFIIFGLMSLAWYYLYR